MTEVIPAQVVQAAATAARDGLIKDGKVFKIDQYRMPWLSFLMARKAEASFTKGKAVQVLQRASDNNLQYIGRRGILDFGEGFPDDEMVWTPFKAHKGREVVHADFEDMGLEVDRNYGNSTGPSVKEVSQAAGQRIFNYWKMINDDRINAFKEGLDHDLLLDGTQDPLAGVGLDGLLPLDNTTGKIAGKNRSDPSFRHSVITGSTVGVGGTLERDLTRGIRNAQTFTRGVSSSIDTIFAGVDWIDAYVAYAQANNIRYQADASKPTSLDISIPDSGLHFNNIRIVEIPTFKNLDAEGAGGATPFAKRAYFLASKNWELGYSKGLDMRMDAPPDPSDQLLSRMSILGKYALMCLFPRGQFVNTIA